MPDAFVTLVAIQPSASVQLETGHENDQVSNPNSQGQMKQGIYAARRKRGTTRQTK